jgi:secondary thiamine-phosphate synthase enzyme
MGIRARRQDKVGTRVITDTIRFKSQGNCDVVNISEEVARAVKDSGLSDGILTVFYAGATGALTTTEFEPGCVEDIKNWFNKYAPEGDYAHHRYHDDGNGHSHLRASLIGPSISVPIMKGAPILGTWQSIIFICFDNRPRNIELIVQMVGE